MKLLSVWNGLMTGPTEQRLSMFDELKYYIEGCEQEQRLRLAGEIPSVEVFWEMRKRTIGGGLALSWIELIIPIEHDGDNF
jgi:hypothetical protein